jgi:metal-responsive CopG/Arc/MetJ family transcriptional regulator
MQKSIAVGISLPRKLMSQIDIQRGDISRSRFLLRLIEHASIAERRRSISKVQIKKSGDPLDHGIETPRSSESICALK